LEPKNLVRSSSSGSLNFYGGEQNRAIFWGSYAPERRSNLGQILNYHCFFTDTEDA